MKNKVIICPFILPWNWSADYQRQTCLELAKRGSFVLAFMQKDAVSIWKKRKKKHALIKYPSIKNIKFFQPKNYLPLNRFQITKQLNLLINLLIIKFKFIARVSNFQTKNAKKVLGDQKVYIFDKKPLLWIFDSNFYFLTKLKKLGFKIIYDCVDYNKKSKKEQKLISQADYFFVNSKILAKKHNNIRKPDLIVPQGFKINCFKKYSQKQKISKAKKPIIGFIGGINQRTDWKLIKVLIKNNKNLIFNFIGPIQDKKTIKIIKQLNNSANFIYQQPIPDKNLAKAIKQFDIGIIPYNTKQQYNLYCYPMKLFEYFYFGKPVIATPIKELLNFPKFVKIGKTVKNWQKHINDILAQPWSKGCQMKQKKLATTNSWENKINAICKFIET